jgi:hypothetical protein
MMVRLLVPWSLWRFRRAPRLVARGLAISLVALAMLVPWTVRNYRVLHSFVPFETGGGDVVLGSYNRVVATDPRDYGYWGYPTSELPEYREQITASNDEVIRIMWKCGWPCNGCAIILINGGTSLNRGFAVRGHRFCNRKAPCSTALACW